MRRFALLLGGPLLATEALKERLRGYRLLAADSGGRHALALGLTPELWLGDFDSSPPWLQEALSAPKEVLPREKDHTLVHLELAFLLAQKGVRVELTDGLTRAFPLLPGLHAFPLRPGTPFSLLPFPEATLGVEGARWDLPPTALKATSRTLENEALGPIRVRLEAGRALLYLF